MEAKRPGGAYFRIIRAIDCTIFKIFYPENAL